MTDPFVYFGTPEVSSETLEYLIAHGYTPALVVTAPDRPQGRGMKLTPTPTKVVAERHSIPVAAFEKIDAAAREEIGKSGASYAIVVAYGSILPKSLIESFPKGVLNVHYSLLPKYRGASPVEAALLNGDTVTGVAVQKMVYELDAGDIVTLREEPIAPADTALTLRPRLIALGAKALVDALPGYLAGTATLTPQDHAQATRCGKIAKEERELDLAGDALGNWNKYRAYAEGPGTHFFTEKAGKRVRVKIKSARFENGSFIPLRVVPEGKNEMAYEDFAR